MSDLKAYMFEQEKVHFSALPILLLKDSYT